MPIKSSAKKKMRQDKKRTVANLEYKKNYKKAVKKVRETTETGKKADKLKSAAYSDLDKAVKKGIIHKKKASRLKSRITKAVKTK